MNEQAATPRRPATERRIDPRAKVAVMLKLPEPMLPLGVALPTFPRRTTQVPFVRAYV